MREAKVRLLTPERFISARAFAVTVRDDEDAWRRGGQR
jgi:hypothetical protein